MVSLVPPKKGMARPRTESKYVILKPVLHGRQPPDQIGSGIAQSLGLGLSLESQSLGLSLGLEGQSLGLSLGLVRWRPCYNTGHSKDDHILQK